MKIVKFPTRRVDILSDNWGLSRNTLWWCVCLFSVFFLLFSACAPKKEVPTQLDKISKYELKQRATSAWQEEEYPLAEELYLKLLQKRRLSKEEKVEIYARISYSAIQNKHFSVAREYMEKWEKLNPDVVDTWEWHECASQVKKSREGDKAYANYLEDLIRQKDVPWAVEFNALKSLNKYYFSRGEYATLWALQKEVYKQAKEKKQKLRMEKAFTEFVTGKTKVDWQKIEDSIPEGRMLQYPYSLLVWFGDTKRLEQELLDWSTARKELGFILDSSELVNKDDLQSRLEELEDEYGLPSLRIALLLPLEGSYQELSWKILQGLDIANWQFTRMEMDVKLTIINTSNSGWKEQLNNLPNEYELVGGPLRKSVWQEIFEDEIHEERTFFTFQSDLNPGKEGESAYRFFPGLKDQVRPLVNYLNKDLDIENFAILYPQSDYGVKRAKIFNKQVAGCNATLTGLSGYTSGSRSGLKDVVAEMLNVPEGYEDKEYGEKNPENATSMERPDPDFKAVFIPDNFNKARLLIPEFFYFGEDRLIFLGPILWSQQIKEIDKLEYGYFNLALMPGGWDPYRKNRAVRFLKQGLRETAQGDADFWVALGYDFLRFAHSLRLHSSTWPPEDMNKRLSRVENFTWSMAPMRWDEKGRAEQDLFLFKPRSRGLFPLDKIGFREHYKEAWEKDQ
ncbi:MAG: hypothetical protein ACOCZ2_00440 [Thermodesulfobacteriota bacterium]